MAKKKELTFADQAKKIIARYKNRLGENLEKDDPLAKRALQRELQELAMQQEAAKQSMQMDDMGGEGGGQPMPAPAMMAYGGGLPRFDPVSAKPIGMSSTYMPTARTAGTMNRVDNSPYKSEITGGGTDKTAFPWTALAAPLAQVAGNTISALTTGKAETASMPTPPQGPSFIEPNYNTARQLAKERNIDAKRSASRYSGPYAAMAIGKQADVELQKELAAIDELENNEKAKAGNAFNMGIYQGQLDWASKDAQMRVANAGMVNKSRENASQYINMAGQNLAKIPQTVYDMGLQKEMLSWLNDRNAGSIIASDGSTVPAFYQYGVYSYKDPKKGLIYMDDAYNIIDENKAKELMRQYKSRIQIKPENMSKTKEGKK